MRGFAWWLFPILTLLIVPRLAPAQSMNGAVTGSVADRNGSAIAGAELKLVSEQTGAARGVLSDRDGDFVFNAVAPGKYTLTVEHAGFKSYRKRGIELTASESVSAGQIKLQLGAVSESITVTAEGATVQLASGERSGLITSTEVENLTVMNRDFATLVALLPGVVDNPGTAEVQGFSDNASFNVQGGRSNGNNITVDGASVENSNANSPNNFVSMDTVQTVRILVSNFQSEFGRKPGASIMAVTKNGARKYHGAAYWYYRHEWMNANDFFNNRNGQPAPPRRVQTPGANIGGPLYVPGLINPRKNKLFFFTSLEFIRERRPQGIRDLTMPTALEREGNFSQSYGANGRPLVVNDPLNGKTPFPHGIIPSSRFDKNGQAYLNLLPLPNFSNQAIAKFAFNYQVQESLNIPKELETTRLDYIVNAKTTVWLKFNWWREDQKGWAVSAGNANWGWMPSHYRNSTLAPVISVTRILSTRKVLEASAGLTRWTEYGGALNQSDVNRLNKQTAGFNVPQLYPAGNPLNLVPNATFGGISNPPNPSLNARFPLRGAETPMVYNASMTDTHGPHVIKTGLFVERWRAIKGESGNWNGTVDFSADTANPGDTNNAFGNALLGNFRSYTESNNRPPLYEYSTGVEWFAQDNWKISKKLVLDLGLRFGWSQPWHSNRRQEAGFVPDTWNPANTIQLTIPVRINNVRQAKDPLTGLIYPATVIGADVTGSGNPFNGTVNLLTDPNYPQGLRNNSGVKLAPRIGFAYDPWGNGKTAIRGGFGVFYEIHEKDLFGYAPQLDPPNQLTPQIFYGNLGSFTNIQGFQFPSNTSGFNPNRPLGRTMNFSFSIQRDIGQGVVIDVAYVGSLARHLLERKNINSIPLGTQFLASSQDPSNPGNPLATQYLRPYLGYGDIQYYNYDANSSYHSLQVTASRRFKHGLQGGLAWTWSKAMDYDDTDTSNLSYLESPRVRNYGEAGFDRTHILKLNWIYELPRVAKWMDKWVPDWKGVSAMSKAVLDGWQLSGISTFMSGAPQAVSLSVTSGSASNWSGSPTDLSIPNVIANPTLAKDQRTFDRYFNIAAFALPAQGTWGNAPRSVFRGPGINNWDISMFKNFKMTERFKAQFRCESYNTFNHTQFAGVNTIAQFNNKTGEMTNLTFGNLTSTRLARRMQLALRVTF